MHVYTNKASVARSMLLK